MNRIRVLRSILLFLFLAISIFPDEYTHAELSRSPGVYSGNWVKYGNFTVLSDELRAQTQFQSDLNKTEWMLITVQVVSLTNITFEVMWRFTNGSDRIWIDWIDVEKGPNPASKLGFLFFISKNLQSNDSLYNVSSETYFGWRINETTSHGYLGAYRETNHLDLSPFPRLLGAPRTRYDNWWDKESGVLTECTYRVMYGYAWLPTIEVHFVIVDALMDPPPTPPSPLPTVIGIILASITMIALAVVFIKKKQGTREGEAKGTRVMLNHEKYFSLRSANPFFFASGIDIF